MMCLHCRFLCTLIFTVCLFGTTWSSANLSSSLDYSITTPLYKEYWLDVGTNITLVCNLSNLYPNSTQWIRDGQHRDQATEFIRDGNFVILNVTKDNEGHYTCTDGDDDTTVFVKYRLHVRQSPGPVKDVKVVARSVMAYIMWSPGDSRGYDITNYTVQYRVKYAALSHEGNLWQHIHPNIELKPTSTFVDIYLLEPNTSYVFRIWANNKLGAGEIVQVEALTKHDNTEIQLARHLLIGLEDFDTRIWLAAVTFVMTTLLILVIAILWLFLRECHRSPSLLSSTLPLRLRKPRLLRTPAELLKRRIRPKLTESSRRGGDSFSSDEIIELVPNIICNPTFDGDASSRGNNAADDGSHL
uniref:Protein turtle homolog A n=1 Tax=Cacopsylla melanoneura TaxID=428564 RepID=A0A8D8YB76_9HEMI